MVKTQPKKQGNKTRHADGRLETVTFRIKPKFVKTGIKFNAADFEKPPELTPDRIKAIAEAFVPSKNGHAVKRVIEVEDDTEESIVRQFARREGLNVLPDTGNTLPLRVEDDFQIVLPRNPSSVRLKKKFAALFAEAPQTYVVSKPHPYPETPRHLLYGQNDHRHLRDLSIGQTMFLSEKANNELERILKEMRSLSSRAMQEISAVAKSGKYSSCGLSEVRNRLILSLVQELRENLDEQPI